MFVCVCVWGGGGGGNVAHGPYAQVIPLCGQKRRSITGVMLYPQHKERGSGHTFNQVVCDQEQRMIHVHVLLSHTSADTALPPMISIDSVLY